MWKCSFCDPYSLPWSLAQFACLKGKPRGHTPGYGLFSVWNQEVCVWSGLSLLILTYWTPHLTHVLFQAWCFRSQTSLESSQVEQLLQRGGEERRGEEKRGVYFSVCAAEASLRGLYFKELAHMIMRTGKTRICWAGPQAGHLRRDVFLG